MIIYNPCGIDDMQNFVLMIYNFFEIDKNPPLIFIPKSEIIKDFTPSKKLSVIFF